MHLSAPGSTTVILYCSVFLRPGYLPFRLYSTRLHDSLPDFFVTPISPATSKNISGLHWLPISTRIGYNVLLIVLKAQMWVAPKYLHYAIPLPTSASSLRPLRSLKLRELFVPRTSRDPFPVLALPFVIAFYFQLVILSYHQLFYVRNSSEQGILP